MKLIPRAKPIRIRISAGGEEHSSLDTFLQQHDIESMLSLYKNGSLSRWLNQIGATAIAGRLNDLKINNFEAITSEEYMKFVSAIYGDNISDIAYKIACDYRIKENSEQNLRWHNIAYKYGNIDSAFELGLIYSDGLYGVEQSNEQAIKYLEMAANANIVDAYLNLGRLLSKVERYDDAEKWLKLALEHGDPEQSDYAFNLELLGDLYYEKDQNDPKVYEYYHKAAIRGSSRAKFNLGYLYEDGIGGVSQDEYQSISWYRYAAKDGYALAQCSVGRYYFDKKCYRIAIPWLQRAVEQEVIRAKVLCSLCLIQIEKFPEKAYNLMLEAANANDSAAQYYMGCFYEEGFSVRKNRNQAIVWYKKAAENGSKDAEAKLIALLVHTPPPPSIDLFQVARKLHVEKRSIVEESTFSIDLFQVARELHVEKRSIVNFLNRKGYHINENEISLNTKLTKRMYDLVIKEFKD